MAMHAAHFDESGDADQGQFVVVAGCIGAAEQWAHFEREWKDALRPYDIALFHAHEFDKRLPPYDRLTQRQADDLFQLLVGIICRRIEGSVARAVPLEQYRVINRKYVFSELYGYPYPAAARLCFAHVAEWAEQHSVLAEEMFVFFEDGAKDQDQLRWIAERDKLPDPVFTKKSELVPLQAADLLAWCYHLHLEKAGNISYRYGVALSRLHGQMGNWLTIDYRDPDRIPTILKIPLRNPDYRYACRIVKHHGSRRALVRFWPRDRKETRLARKALVIPEPPILTWEEVEEAKRQYDERRAKMESIGPAD